MLFVQKQDMLVIGDERIFLERASNHARCGIWHTLFSEMDGTRKFGDKK